MPGRELYGEEEIREVVDVLRRKVLFRYGFDRERQGIFKTAEFERAFAAFAGSRYALGVSSGSAALKVALEALNLPRGGEVVAPCFTFVATIEAIQEAGLTPVLCEVDASLNMDPSDLARRITRKTVAVMPVHMMGNACRMDEIMAIARERNLKVVEDACQATGVSFRGKKAGTFGDAGCFSFDYVKVMTTGEGGMVVTDSEEVYRQADWYHDHGHPHQPDLARGKEPRKRSGFNYRMSELQAALGIVQLRKLTEVIRRQKENKKAIKAALRTLPGISFRVLPDEDGEIATFLTFFAPKKAQAEAARARMAEMGVPPAVLDYWHFQANIESCGGSFPATKDLLDRMVTVEIQAAMDAAQVEKVSSALVRAGKEMA